MLECLLCVCWFLFTVHAHASNMQLSISSKFPSGFSPAYSVDGILTGRSHLLASCHVRVRTFRSLKYFSYFTYKGGKTFRSVEPLSGITHIKVTLSAHQASDISLGATSPLHDMYIICIYFFISHSLRLCGVLRRWQDL